MTAASAPSAPPNQSPTRVPLYALVGNPNCGKTTVFNALTGLRQKVGNYPGVTVEKKEGRLRLPDGSAASLIDLPGLYSLTPRSPDEAIARDVLLGHRSDVAQPDGIVHVVDAANLERNLYLTAQILDLGLPTVLVLTMTDVAARTGQTIDIKALEKTLGVPVRTVLVSKKQGLDTVLSAISELSHTPLPPRRDWFLPTEAELEVAQLSEMLQSQHGTRAAQSTEEAVGLLMAEAGPRPEEVNRWSPSIWKQIEADKAKFSALGIDFSAVVVESRYAWAGRIAAQTVKKPRRAAETLTDRIDRVVMHPFWGYIIFFGVMAFIFQTIFTWAQLPMNGIGAGISALQNLITAHMPPGDLRDLLVNGIIAGVGTTITFLPQILLLFFAIALLEDTGYMARAAFLMDKIMSKVGLHGKSFIPLLSSFACAIPGIMATRTIDDRKSRLVTILVAPLMSCSARIPRLHADDRGLHPQPTHSGYFYPAGSHDDVDVLSGDIRGIRHGLGLQKDAAAGHPADLLFGDAAVPCAEPAHGLDDHARAVVSVRQEGRHGHFVGLNRAVVPVVVPEVTGRNSSGPADVGDLCRPRRAGD